MNSILRLLEEWNAYQDYLWFLALLAWGGVVAAEVRRGENGRLAVLRGWLATLALGGALGALTELALLAQRLVAPYTKLDAAMGAAQALGAAALAWQAAHGARRAVVWRGVAIAVIAALAVVRVPAPVLGGLGLALAQAGAVFAIVRRTPGVLPRATALLLALAPIVATHGPWANALRHGREITDWSHFALGAATVSLATAVLFAATSWRRRLRETAPGLTRGDDLDRDLRRATAWLAAWLVAGVLLAVWYGRVARRAFEENLLRRVETCVLALNPQTLAHTLVPELEITRIEQRRYPDGAPIAVAVVPHSLAPVYSELRTQLTRLREQNPDFALLYILTPRQGQMLLLSPAVRRRPSPEHSIHQPVTDTDIQRMAAARSYLEGPVHHPYRGSKFLARAPLQHPDNKTFLGWLTVEIEAAQWMATFVQARLQTMSLVAAGVGLWIVAVAYRLRREGREEAERKAAEAAAADRMKSAFLAKVSHELRTPIQSVLGYGELLATAPLGEPHRSFLAALRSHGGVMLRLVNDLIDLGALQSGAFRLESAPVNLAALVNDCAVALRPAAAEKGLVFHVGVAPDVPSWVLTDGVRMRQILLNLLTNAVKFTRAGSVRCDVLREGADVTFTISDTGPGIPPTQRARLFQPFARLDPAAGGGSGLGLALVQGLCGAMGGKVALEDRSAAGATFVVRLPLQACAMVAVDEPARARVTPPHLAGMRVLLAEDNPLVRELLMAFLKEQGVSVSVATDGPNALALARVERPDVVLLDVALPGIDGIQVAAQLRQLEMPGLRIVGLSAHATAEDEIRARASGMDEFLIKPVSLAHLADVLANFAPAAPRTDAALPSSDGMSAKLRETLYAQFSAETPRILDDLRSALASADWARLRQRAHYLKNSADVLGLAPLQAACWRACELDDESAAARATELVAAITAAIPSSLFVLADTSAADPR